MRSIPSLSRTALVHSLDGLLLGVLCTACNARLDISEETVGGAGAGGHGGLASSEPPPARPDAGVPSNSCADGVRSGAESDIDCGGDDCAACVTGASCARHGDCQDGQCLAGVCAGSSCEDGLRNGEETGVDCGGDCQRCRSNSCNCASSPELMPLECDETEGYLTPCGQRFLSADGETFVFALCYMASAEATATTGYELFMRHSNGTTEALGDGGALGISADGQRVLIDEDGALRIVHADGARTLVPIPQAFAADVRLSGDGATVVGGLTEGTSARRLVRWTESAGLEPLGEFPLLAQAQGWELGAVSHDGAAVAGSAYDGSRFAPFRWTPAGGLEELGPLPEGITGAQPTAISADGSAIAGVALGSGSARSIFRWTAPDQLQILGTAPPPGYLPDAALFLSADGSIVAGTALNGAPSVIVWGPDFTVPANAELAVVTDMTPDGSTLVGTMGGTTGFLWHPPGVREPVMAGSGYDVTRIDTLLAETGADAAGWALQTITNISDDGRLVYGTGTCGGVPTFYRMRVRP